MSTTLRVLEAPSEAPPPRRSAARLILGRWLPVAAYVSLIFVLSSQPNLHAPVQFQNSDKLAHLLEYGGLGWLLGRALRATFGWPVGATAALVTFAIGASIGASDEWWQSHVPGRDSTVLDWCADSLGLVLSQFVDLVFVKDDAARPPRP